MSTGAPLRCPDSPGSVRDEETLALGLYSPDVFDVASGLVTVEALKLDYFLGPKKGHVDKCGESTGLSVARFDPDAGRPELHRTLKALRAGRDRTIEGAALIQAGALRSIQTGDGLPALVVLDDGKPGFTTHAVVRGRDGLSRSGLKDPREQLRMLLNSRLDRSWPSRKRE